MYRIAGFVGFIDFHITIRLLRGGFNHNESFVGDELVGTLKSDLIIWSTRLKVSICMKNTFSDKYARDRLSLNGVKVFSDLRLDFNIKS